MLLSISPIELLLGDPLSRQTETVDVIFHSLAFSCSDGSSLPEECGNGSFFSSLNRYFRPTFLVMKRSSFALIAIGWLRACAFGIDFTVMLEEAGRILVSDDDVFSLLDMLWF